MITNNIQYIKFSTKIIIRAMNNKITKVIFAIDDLFYDVFKI